MRLIIVCFTILLMIGCKQMANSQPINKNKKDHFITQIMQAPLASPPIGDKHVLYPFATHWQHADTENERSGSEKAFDELAGNLDKQSQSEQSYKITLTQENLKQIVQDSYDIPFNINDILNQKITVHVEKIAGFPQFDLFLLTTENLELECNHCEYGNHLVFQSIISISSHQIVDRLVATYEYGNDLSRGYRFFYYDNGKIIIRRFGSNETDSAAKEKRTYQLTPQGKFIRYYDTNGSFQNTDLNVTEEGLVQNHTREGVWIEITGSKYAPLDIGYIYLESEYKNGLLDGVRKCYQLDYQKKLDGSKDLSSAKKGKLLYTETYKDGELVERKFVDKEIDELN
ncbi:hypothetical protein [Gilliamella sp. ESL0405]|uniref:hypothetical protein n=2 Tax=unclassified Gilliamella TaxID=2685620 RepID=UPI001C6A1A9E|nr:hypothetical protein [Gilliamella sp. ESL0405]QYN45780.1 hypothetical protein GYM74_00465 [Gilliamella sp. ESL0405]